jgi:hypothetical protein
MALSPQANYNDWATATCRRNFVSTSADRGVSRGQRSGTPTVVNLSFLDQFGMTVTNQNLIQEETKRRLNSGNACYYSIQNLLPSCLLSENIKITVYKTIILLAVLYGCETLSLTLWEEHRPRVIFFRIGCCREYWTEETWMRQQPLVHRLAYFAFTGPFWQLKSHLIHFNRWETELLKHWLNIHIHYVDNAIKSILMLII